MDISELKLKAPIKAAKPKCIKAQEFLNADELPSTIEESGDVAKVWWWYENPLGGNDFKYYKCIPVYEVWGAKKRKKYIEKELANEKSIARKNYFLSLYPQKRMTDKKYLKPDHKYTRRPDVAELLVLDHEGNPTKCAQGAAWAYLEINLGIIKDKNGRPAWKDPTPTGNRMIAIGFTKVGDEVYDGDISLEGRKVAVFRFGTLHSA